MSKAIRILHTEWSDGWGGQEIRIIREMIAVRKKGIEVFLACREHSIIKQKAQENNIEVFTLPFKGNSDIKTLFKLRRIIRDNEINFVNTHSGKDTWVGGLAAKSVGINFIRTRHLSNRIRSSRANFINELADYIITTGESIRSEMIKLNRIKPEKIESIPTGINCNLYNPTKYNKKACRDLFNLNDDQIVIGAIAVLRRFKRHDRFIKMVRYVINENPTLKIKILIAGEGPQREKISEMITNFGLKENISMLGHIDNVPELIKALDIFILTSDSGEGVPQSVMQALLMKVAVVSTDAGSIRDLHSEDNFILVNKDSQDQLNIACNQLINDKNLREKYQKKSREYILQNFSKEKMVEKLMKVYFYLNQ